LLGELDAGGLLDADHHEGAVRLTGEVQDLMAAEMKQWPDGTVGVKRELLRAGIQSGSYGLAGQLALWARELSEWAALERLWLRFPPQLLYSSHLAKRAYSQIPEHVRGTWPALGQAAAFLGGGSGQGLQGSLWQLVADGWALHGRWRLQPRADGAVAAAAARLLAETSLIGSGEDPDLETASARSKEIERFIAEQSTSGRSPSPLTLAFFHAVASSTAILRRDWRSAKRHAQLGMAFSPECEVSGLISVVELALASLMMGSPREYERAMHIFEQHTDHSCQAAARLQPFTHLPRAVAAVRLLQRDQVAAHLARLEPVSGGLWRLSSWPLQLWISSFAGVLWGEPEKALAEFDAGLHAADEAGMGQGPWAPLLCRARVELLLSLGAVNRAGRALAELQREDRDVALVPTARLKLFARDFVGAAAVAEEGLYSLRLPLHDRAHLEVVKAAAAMLSGERKEAVTSLVDAACLVCQESGTLLPFAMLPPGLRDELVTHHSHERGREDCLLGAAIAGGRFADVVPKAWWGNFPVTLTAREQTLLWHLVRGLSLSEIAEMDYVSVNTLRKQESALRQKLEAHSRAELLSKASRFGLVAPVGTSW
jgi:DNA-binding CsgD family transcriptional regulator